MLLSNFGSTKSFFNTMFICTNCGKKGRFKVIKKYLVDTQRIMLEEAPEDLEGGEQPEHINIVLKKDLVDPKFERSIIYCAFIYYPRNYNFVTRYYASFKFWIY